MSVHAAMNVVYRCPACIKSFPSIEAIGEHLRVVHHGGVAASAVSASGAGNVNSTASGSVGVGADAVVKHPCPICPEQFTTKASMKIHLQNAHFATGLHECPTCKRMFSSRATLKRHQVRHTMNYSINL